MKQFKGFPTKMTFTPIPNLFINKLLPQIDDLIELKTTLLIFELLYRKRGYPTYVTYEELWQSINHSDNALGQKEPEQALRKALETIVKKGIFLRIYLKQEDKTSDIYMLNNSRNQQVAEKIMHGNIGLKGSEDKTITVAHLNKLPGIFTLYEENIGILTPMIADELREAEKIYPEAWIQDAIKEAISQNKRKWKYISAILERWSLEGKDNGIDRRHTQKTDPKKYVKGQYGHMVRH
jgi:DnaD/phage-associated family protein